MQRSNMCDKQLYVILMLWPAHSVDLGVIEPLKMKCTV